MSRILNLGRASRAKRRAAEEVERKHKNELRLAGLRASRDEAEIDHWQRLATPWLRASRRAQSEHEYPRGPNALVRQLQVIPAVIVEYDDVRNSHHWEHQIELTWFTADNEYRLVRSVSTCFDRPTFDEMCAWARSQIVHEIVAEVLKREIVK